MVWTWFVERMDRTRLLVNALHREITGNRGQQRKRWFDNINELTKEVVYLKPNTDYMTDRCGGRLATPSSEAFQLKMEGKEERRNSAISIAFSNENSVSISGHIP